MFILFVTYFYSIWLSGFNPMRNADSLLSPLKETVINYLNPFQMYGKTMYFISSPFFVLCI